ncbi:hypothetical protein J5226_04890 [Lysobacter sp. K5869]|uniref:hypothetical protein n=1 Tax=Lysobacter sp. K5869 TaxID=2820808 RepID=UPI001C06458A|nr:hypothetical protein [Lysobacter sp. K5869]QWP77754.1 hypothetical protein J5226_04890 [Lysobacter sp. K5869]
MEDNLYAPPASNVVEPAPSAAGAAFYVVAPYKFCLLFFATLGLYQLYWFYMQWARYRRHSGETLWAVPRTIFAIFYTHALAGRIDAVLRERGERYDWSPGGVATLYVLAQIASTLFDRFTARMDSAAVDLVSLAMLIPIGLSLLRLQQAANLASGDARGDSNRGFSAANYVWTILGALLWLVMLIGLMDAYPAG